MNEAATIVDWRPVETAPLDKYVLLWWRPRGENIYAECAIFGQVSSYEPGKYWNGEEYRDLSHISHWAPAPCRPLVSERAGRREVA